MDGVTHYEVLGVSPDADAATLKSAYRTAARAAHPDTGGNDGLFRAVQTAWSVLSDDVKRAAYDASLARGAAPNNADGATSHPGGSGSGTGDGATTPASSAGPDSRLVDVSRLTWMSSLDRDAAPRVSPAVPEKLKNLHLWLHGASFLLAIVTCALTYTAGVDSLYGWTPAVTACTAAIMAAAAAWRLQLWPAAFSLCGLLILFGPSGPMHVGLLGVLGSFVSTMAGFWQMGRRRILRMDLDAVLSVSDAAEYSGFGSVGVPFSAAHDDVRRVATRTGSDALRYLTLIPGARILHRVAAPRRPDLGADQVVLVDDKAAIVVNRAWLPGTYSWTTHGVLLHGGGHFPGGDVHSRELEAALAAAGVRVRTFVLVSSAAGRVAVPQPDGPDGAWAGTVHDAVEAMGNWLLEDTDPTLVRRDVLVKLAHGLVAGQ